MITKDSKDWVAWDLQDFRMFPRGRSNNRHLANLVFNGGNCLDMWVDGRPLRRDGETLSINEKDVLSELEDAVQTYYSDV